MRIMGKGWISTKPGLSSWSNSSTACPEVIKKLSCSAHLIIKFSLLINMKMPKIVGIFIFIAEKFSYSAVFSKKEFELVSNLRFISKINFKIS